MFNALITAKTVIAALVIQALTVTGIVTTTTVQEAPEYTNTKAVAQTSNAEDQKYIDCLARPVSERQACAAQIGKELSTDLSLSPGQKIQSCMKLRPVFVKYCLEELR